MRSTAASPLGPFPLRRLNCCRRMIVSYPASVLMMPLPQVLPGNLLPDAVSWFFTSVLKGLQIHGQHDGCMAALVHLAFQIYEALVRNCQHASLSEGWWETLVCLDGHRGTSGPQGGQLHWPYFSLQRPRYAELKVVMEQIPDIQRDSLEQFDSKLLNPTLQKVADKRRKDHFKRLITGCIGVGDILGENTFHLIPVPCRSVRAVSLLGSPCPPPFPAKRLLQQILTVCPLISLRYLRQGCL